MPGNAFATPGAVSLTLLKSISCSRIGTSSEDKKPVIWEVLSIVLFSAENDVATLLQTEKKEAEALERVHTTLANARESLSKYTNEETAKKTALKVRIPIRSQKLYPIELPMHLGRETQAVNLAPMGRLFKEKLCLVFGEQHLFPIKPCDILSFENDALCVIWLKHV